MVSWALNKCFQFHKNLYHDITIAFNFFHLITNKCSHMHQNLSWMYACTHVFILYKNNYLFNKGPNHIFDVLHNAIWLTICSTPGNIMPLLSVFIMNGAGKFNLSLTGKQKDNPRNSPTATFVSPGRSTSVRLTTAKSTNSMQGMKWMLK